MNETKKRFVTEGGRELRIVHFTHEADGIEWSEYAVYDGHHAVYDGFDTMAEAVEAARMEAQGGAWDAVDEEDETDAENGDGTDGADDAPVTTSAELSAAAPEARRKAGIDMARRDVGAFGGWYARNVADAMLDEIADGECMSDFAEGYVSAVEAMDEYIRRDR